MFGGLSLCVLYGYFIEGVTKKHDDLVGTALLEALAGCFMCFGESDYTHDRSRGPGSRARGEGRERCNLQVTTPKPPVAQSWWDIWIF